MATKPLVGLVALLGLAGAGYAAWAYYGHGGHACCRIDDSGREGPQAAAPGSAPAADDATLIASQVYCPVMPDTKLGEMGPPVRLTVTGKDGKDEPVFVCCKGCRRKALADPDATLARVSQFRAATR